MKTTKQQKNPTKSLKTTQKTAQNTLQKIPEKAKKENLILQARIQHGLNEQGLDVADEGDDF